MPVFVIQVRYALLPLPHSVAEPSAAGPPRTPLVAAAISAIGVVVAALVAGAFTFWRP